MTSKNGKGSLQRGGSKAKQNFDTGWDAIEWPSQQAKGKLRKRNAKKVVSSLDSPSSLGTQP